MEYFLIGHDLVDLVSDRKDLLAQLDEATIAPSTPCLCVVDGDKKYIHVYHDESTFYANTGQTRFWNDGQSQVLGQKVLGSSIMHGFQFIVDTFITKRKQACLCLETLTKRICISTVICSLSRLIVQQICLIEEFPVSLAFFFSIMLGVIGTRLS